MDGLFKPVTLMDGRYTASQSQFEYLECSSRPEADLARRTLERWFARYPQDHQAAFRQRFRSNREIDHTSAYFELALHELLLCQGARHVVVEPELPHVAASPDFEITWADGSLMYLEATSATGGSDRSRGRKRNEETLVERVRSIESRDFYIELHILTPVTSLDGIRTVVHEIQAFLGSLSYDDVAAGFRHMPATFDGVERQFSCRISRAGFELEVTAIPKGEMRGATGECLAFWHSEADVSYSTTQSDVKAAIGEKSSKYGNLQFPYAVAINVFNWGLDRHDVAHALLGTQTVRWTVDTKTGDTLETSLVYGKDGALGAPWNQKRSQVSAILCANHWTAWNSPERRLYVAHNPWAANGLGKGLFGGQDIVFDSKGRVAEHGTPDVTGILPRR